MKSSLSTSTTDTKVAAKATNVQTDSVKESTVVKKEAEKKPVEKKTSTAKKTAAPKKTAQKKTTVSTTNTTKKTVEVTPTYILQYSGKEVVTNDILTNVKNIWIEKFQGKLEEIKSIEIYIKPEENRAYFVVNGLSNGDYFVEI